MKKDFLTDMCKPLPTTKNRDPEFQSMLNRLKIYSSEVHRQTRALAQETRINLEQQRAQGRVWA